MPEDMSVETLGPNFDQSRFTARPEVRAKSIVTQALEAQVLKQEALRIQNFGEIVDFIDIDGSVAVIAKDGDKYRAIIDSNRLTELPLFLTAKAVKEDIRSRGEDYVPITPNSEHSGRIKRALQANASYPPGLVPILTAEWFNQAPRYIRGGINHTNQDQVPDNITVALTDARLEVRSDPLKGNQLYVNYNNGRDHILIPPDEPDKPVKVAQDQYEKSEPRLLKLAGGIGIRTGSNVLSIFDTANKAELITLSGYDPIVDPLDNKKILFINTGRIYSYDTSGAKDRSSRPQLEGQFQLNDPMELEIDPYGNFIIVRNSNNQLQIVDRETGDVAKEFSDVRGPVMVSNQGDILTVTNDNKLLRIQTNFQAIPAGGSEAARQKREEELKAMQERFANLELGKVQRQSSGEITEEDVANTLREAIARQVDEPLAQAAAPEAIEDIMDRLQGLKGDSANQGYGEVIDEFIGKAREKLSGIRAAEFDTQLGEYEKSLEGIKSVGDTIGLDEEFARLLDLRQKTDITDPAVRRNIEQRLRTIQTQKDLIVGQYQEELRAAIDQSLPNIEQLIRETGSSQELAMFGTTVEAQQFEMMLANIRDPQARRELRDRLNAVKTEQRTGLEARGRQLEDEQRLRWAQVVEEAKEDLDSLRAQITELSEAKELDRFERNPLVTAWRAKIFALPKELREIEEKKLEVILGARKKDIEHRKELGVVGETGELKFGEVSFPFYKEPPRIWRPVLLPIKGAMQGLADLAFQDEQGRVWHPDPEHRIPVISDMNHEQTARMIERFRREAEEYFKGIKREVPEYNDRWKISDYQNKKLEELAESLNIQLDNHMGLTILEGEAGTGKNVLIDVLANLSNREVITIACNENTAKEDLTYEFYYDPEKGTYKLPSRLIEALQRPGVIILFDEINTVKPGIVKMLNPLFDYRRKLVVSEGGVQQEVVANPTAILVGTMNPQDYAGVDRLAETILSRSDIIEVGYPPFEEMVGGRTRYRSDEAEMLYSYVHVLEDLRQGEFKMAWDYVINRDTTNGGDRLLQANGHLETDIRRLYDAIRVANRLREMYQAYQVGESNEPMDFTTSLREMVNISLRLNHARNVKDVARRVILPKIGDRRQRVLVGQTIDALLPS